MTNAGKTHAAAPGEARPSAPDMLPGGDLGVGTEGGDDSLGDVLARLIDTGRAYADAEIDRQKLRAVLIGAGLRTITILVVVALILLFGTLVTLMLGLMLALAPLLTPLGATAAVGIGGILIVALLLLLARRRLRALLALGKLP